MLDVPRPVPDATEVLVRTVASVISPGTERAVTALAQASLLAKARARPDLVRQVVRKARTEGLAATTQTVRSRLAEDLPLGYSAAGRVVEVGAAVTGVRAGQLVATGGAGKANHAEFQAVPGLLCAAVPDGVPAQDAAFTTIASIALHALRLAEVGPGIEGRRARPWLDRPARCQARHGRGLRRGRHRPGRVPPPGGGRLRRPGPRRARRRHDGSSAHLVTRPGRGRGAGVRGWPVVRRRDAGSCAVPGPRRRCGGGRRRPCSCAVPRSTSGSSRCASPAPTARAATSRRMRPGEWTIPAGQVRWTEGRNFEAVLDLLAAGRLQVSDLVTHTYDIAEAAAAYKLIEERADPYLAIRLTYPGGAAPDGPVRLRSCPPSTSSPGVGWVGAGAFSTGTLLPAFRAAGFDHLVAVASASGLSARRAAERHGFEKAVSGADAVIGDPDVEVVVIATPHDTHEDLAARALRAGRHVWCEKPLALTADGLDAVESAWRASGRQLAVGFNRRWSPAVVAAQRALAGVAAPKLVVYRVAAGPGAGRSLVPRPAAGRSAAWRGMPFRGHRPGPRRRPDRGRDGPAGRRRPGGAAGRRRGGVAAFRGRLARRDRVRQRLRGRREGMDRGPRRIAPGGHQ